MVMSKRLVFLIFALKLGFGFGQTLTFTLSNPQVVNGGADFQFEVQLHASASGSFHIRGQVYLNYNTAAFGSSIASGVTVTRLNLLNETAEVFGSTVNKYAIVNTVNNASSILAITWEGVFMAAPPSALAHTEVPTSPADLLRIRIPIVNSAVLAGISFNEGLMNGEQFKIVGANDNDPYGNPNNYNNNGFALQPLPLRLVSFTAEVAGEDIRLAWQSEAEVNFSGFEVERSETGAQFFVLGWVKSLGLQGRNQYEFIDRSALPGRRSFYRLKMTDLDGSFDYSPVRSAMIPHSRAAPVLFPNPTASNLMADLSAFAPGQSLQVEVFDLSGKKLHAFSLRNPGGAATPLWTADRFPKGIYLVRLAAENGDVFVERVVVE